MTKKRAKMTISKIFSGSFKKGRQKMFYNYFWFTWFGFLHTAFNHANFRSMISLSTLPLYSIIPSTKPCQPIFISSAKACLLFVVSTLRIVKLFDSAT